MVAKTPIQTNIYETQQTSTEKDVEQFQWTKQWYPVAVAEFLDSSRPHAIQLLGKNLVLWCDHNKQWHCFDNACPHRLVPLSEGRVESDGTLLCAYHAWRFDGEGRCVKIPQSKDKETEAKHCANPKSCAISYPTQERQGLVWIWPESGTQGQIESRQRSPRIVPELEENSDQVVQLWWNIRDYPYGWDFWMENVLDPAHVPISHHGIMGDRYQHAQYLDMIRIREMSTQEGFSYEVTPTPVTIEPTAIDFQPPCLIRFSSTLPDGSRQILVLYGFPTRPGYCRAMACQLLIKNNAGKLPPGVGFFGISMPTWFAHVFSSLFIHQDLVFLHYQQQIFAQKHQDRWLDAVYTPNPQDKMVIAFRQWLEKRAGGGIPWDAKCDGQLPSTAWDKQKLFDVWTTHTKDCQVCQKALKNINRLIVLAYVGTAICFGLGVMVDARAIASSGGNITGIPPLGFWVAIGAAILLAVGGYFLHKFSRLFYVYEFEHAHNNSSVLTMLMRN
ncbi:MAG: Rieske 2Fe-2S domain-containing protein [Symploca sp. SIO1B1]|nr:Rieske 2Fe-2S domain-containing protein [Symploca sp. SIO1B1]